MHLFFRFSQIFFLVFAALFFEGCLPRKYSINNEIPVAAPSSFKHAEEYPECGMREEVLGSWWPPFQSEELNFFMEKVIENNLDIKSSWARLLAARAEVMKAKANKRPELDLGVGVELEWNPADNDNHGLGLGGLINPVFSYEYDLFGRLNALVNAAFHEYRFSYYDEEVLALSLTGAFFDSWVDANESAALIALFQKQKEISGRLLELLHLRFIIGESTALDVNQQKLQFKSLDLEIIEEEATFDLSNNSLYILMGESPAENFFFPPQFEIDLPPIPMIGSPAELLFMRPDLKKAYEDFLSSGFDLKAALLDCYPRLVFPISLEIAIGGLSNVIDEALLEAAISLVGPLYDGGRRRAGVQKARALLEQKLYQIGSVFLNAIGEVENALVEEKKELNLIQALKIEIETAQVILDMAEESYVRGLVDYLTVIAAIQKLQSLEREFIHRKAKLIKARGVLYRSLGFCSFW